MLANLEWLEVIAWREPLASKYDPLGIYLSRQRGARCTLSFSDVERILGEDLPASARNIRQWWQNSYLPQRRSPQSNHGWQGAGWSTVEVDMAREMVTFVRSS
jgi:hypothetical protein